MYHNSHRSRQPPPPPAPELPPFLFFSEPLLPVPLLLPARKPRRLIQRPDLPPFPHQAPRDLLPRPLLRHRQHDVLDVPRTLVLHQALLAFLQYSRQQGGHVGFVAELGHGREERFEVEDDGAAEGQAAERLPVDAEVDAGEGEVGLLVGAEVSVGVAGGHEEGSVDFEAPGAALDGSVWGEAGEVSIFKKFLHD